MHAVVFMSDSSTKPTDTNPYPLWAPRFWHGMLFTSWIRLLFEHGFRIHPLRLSLALTVTISSSFNSKMRLAQLALLGHKINQTPVPKDPVFILGHWRSGTTFLHELLSVDDRFASPTTYQCFCPHHFLLTESILTRLLWFLIPSKRPMDNVKAGWHEPQEDEFALCSMGIPSPYFRIAFPNDEPCHLDYLDMERLGPAEIEQWQKALYSFLQCLAYRNENRIVLKSPTHTGRLAMLAEMFPDAKFIHIVRDPYDVVPSTIRLWKSLDAVQGFQIPHHENLDQSVWPPYQRMYAGFEKARPSIDDSRIVDIKYESLVASPCEVLEQVYAQLDLGDFSSVEPKLRKVLDAKKDYKRNRHQLDDKLIQKINEHWHAYFDKYEYQMR